MKTIWKYPLKPIESQVVELPGGAKILTAQLQGNQLCLWALVNTLALTESRKIRIYGTEHPISNQKEHRYISTYQLADGEFIFHVFEEIGNDNMQITTWQCDCKGCLVSVNKPLELIEIFGKSYHICDKHKNELIQLFGGKV